MRVSGIVLVVVGAAVTIGATGCTGRDEETPVGTLEVTRPSSTQLSESSVDIAGEWTLVGGTADGKQLEVDSTAGVSFMPTADGFFTGFDGCNWFEGAWRIDGSSIEIPGYVSDLAGCPSDEAFALAEGWSWALSLVDTVAVDRDSMTMSSSTEQKAELRFQLDPTADGG